MECCRGGGFLRQSFAFSALGQIWRRCLRLPRLSTEAVRLAASHLLIVGDWGYEDFEAQSACGVGDAGLCAGARD